LDTFVAKGMM